MLLVNLSEDLLVFDPEAEAELFDLKVSLKFGLDVLVRVIHDVMLQKLRHHALDVWRLEVDDEGDGHYLVYIQTLALAETLHVRV